MNAIRLGVAPAARVQGILSYFKARWQAHGSQISQPAPSMADPCGHTIEPLNNTWEVMARFGSGDTAGALDLMRRLWGMQVDPNSGYYTGTFWEFVNSNGLPVPRLRQPRPRLGRRTRPSCSPSPSSARPPSTRATRPGRSNRKPAPSPGHRDRYRPRAAP